jgi:hypothetical protein
MTNGFYLRLDETWGSGQPVTQILALRQNKNQKHNDDASRRQGPGERPNDASHDLKGAGGGE